MEVWKNINDFPNYQISNLGNIKNNKGKTLKPYINQNGYLVATLYKNIGKNKKIPIHRLVAQAFIPNTNNHPQVNHKNGIKNDNRVCNLEWCSALENNIHAIKTGLRPSLSEEQRKIASERLKVARCSMKHYTRKVMSTNIKTGEIKIYSSIVETQKDGFIPQCVNKCCKGKYKYHKDHYWKYI